MFDKLKLTPPDDMFAQIDKSAPQMSSPTAPEVVPTSDVQTTPVSESDAMVSNQEPKSESIVDRRISELSTSSKPASGHAMKTIVIVLAIIVVIGGAFFISWRILTSRTPVTPKAPVSQVEDENGFKGGVEEEETAGVGETIIEETPQPVVDVDTDKDGLTDAQEAQYGTSVTTPDTDADGLFDREEIQVYSTDPLNSDTDGDTYLDGNEIKAGFNPKGTGKLLEVPK